MTPQKNALDALNKLAIACDPCNETMELVRTIRAALQAAQAPVTGETSDGYHTFNELYEHRHALFIALTKVYKSRSWKSKHHSDGSMFNGWFIAGIATTDGQVTYHLPMRLWDAIEVDELSVAPPWDGHTADDVIKRIGTLQAAQVPEEPRHEWDDDHCKKCGDPDWLAGPVCSECKVKPLPADRAAALDVSKELRQCINAVDGNSFKRSANGLLDKIEVALMQPAPAPVEKVEGLAEALREFDDLPEQETTSLIILKAARLQLARQEGK